MDGGEMEGLLAYLKSYVPADAAWSTVRTAPATPERKLMGFHSMRPPLRRLLDVLRDGEVSLTLEGVPQTFTADALGLKVPKSAFKAYIAAVGDNRKAEDSDVFAMFAKVFPSAEIEPGQGNVGDAKDIRWLRFPVDVLGEAVDSALLMRGPAASAA